MAPMATAEDSSDRLVDAVAHLPFVTADSDRLAPLLTDWRGTKTGTARLLAEPRNSEEVQMLVRAAAASATPLVPQGGNTGLVGGSVPEADGRAVLVSLRRMDRVRDLDSVSQTVVVEAGLILQQLHEAAADAGLQFPLSLGAKGSATVGGLISTNAGGTQVLRYGTMRAQVLGLEAVLPDGTLVDQLTPLRKDNTGYDIKQLFIGAEGTLGIVTAASLRLVPAPQVTATAIAALDTPDAALELLSRLQAATGGIVDSFELIPRIAVDLVTRHVPGTRDPLTQPYPWYVLAELTSSEPGRDLASLLEGALADAIEAGTVADAVVAQTGQQRDEFWQLRETIAVAEREDGPALKHDITVPVADMPRFLRDVGGEIEARWPGTSIFAFGHLGDGNIHFNVRSEEPPPRAELVAKKAEIADFVYERIADFGGSISAEHGIGTLKAAALARLGDPGKLAAMRAIKSALDPQNIMNPGKVLS